MQCPCLVIQGTEDAIAGPDAGPKLAGALGRRARLVELAGSGHAPHTRDPVQVNLLIREFVTALQPGAPVMPRRWTRGHNRRRRALYISSPIGLGHAHRDVAIATELRKLRPGPGDRLASPAPGNQGAGGPRRAHPPGQRALASESRHIECESAEHDLHCFQALRRMDEILLANFMVFHDVVDEDLRPVDWRRGLGARLLPAREPREKRAAYVWMTDFVGWLPMPDGGEHEAC